VDEFDLIPDAATRVGCSLMLLYGLSWSMERDFFSAIFLAAYFYNVSSPPRILLEQCDFVMRNSVRPLTTRCLLRQRSWVGLHGVN